MLYPTTIVGVTREPDGSYHAIGRREPGAPTSEIWLKSHDLPIISNYLVLVCDRWALMGVPNEELLRLNRIIDGIGCVLRGEPWPPGDYDPIEYEQVMEPPERPAYATSYAEWLEEMRELAGLSEGISLDELVDIFGFGRD
jgi:hypothetical protein